MTLLAVVFLLVNAVALLLAPRRYAAVPLLAGCCYVTIGQGVEIAGLRFPLFRMLLAIGAFRVIVKGERMAGGFSTVDVLVLVWGIWMMVASVFHEGEGAGPIFASGIVYNVLLGYFLFRIFTNDEKALLTTLRCIAIVLIPLAVEMFQEKLTGRNVFAIFGGVEYLAPIREGKIRAQGPFRHSILAGTVGAACLPLMIAILKCNPKLALAGALSCGTIVLASASSGPIVSAVLGTAAVIAWPYRRFLPAVRKLMVVMYILLMLVMTRPPYYLISKIDLTGGSTGWYRSRLIESSIEHLSEWWLYGTDRTVHWMPTGVEWNKNHSDITNYYIQFGVWGGLISTLLLIAIVALSFRNIGRVIRSERQASTAFSYWCIGGALFAHATSAVSVTYFDQSLIFFWMTLAMATSIRPRERDPLAPSECLHGEPTPVGSIDVLRAL